MTDSRAGLFMVIEQGGAASLAWTTEREIGKNSEILSIVY